MNTKKGTSNLATPTKGSAENQHFPFLKPKKSITGTAEGQKMSVNQFLMKNKIKPARLCKPSVNAKDQRWFIEYYIFDEAIGKTRRIKEYEVNNIESVRQRSRFARLRILDLNNILFEGAYINSAEDEARDEFQKIRERSDFLTLNDAFSHFIKHLEKKNARKRSIRQYGFVFKKFSEFNKSRGIHNPLIFKITRDHIEYYLDRLMDQEGLSARSRNNHLGFLKTIFIYAYKQLAPDHIGEPPICKISKIPTSVGRNIAFSDDQISELTKYMAIHDPDVLFLCQFMYYTLARPGEIAQLKVKHIGMIRNNCIFIPGEVSKNRMDRHVEITPALGRILQKRGIYEQDPENFIISPTYSDGKKPKNPKKIGSGFRKVLDKLGYSKDYTLYSWKHTGVVKAWKAGMSQASIQTQMGHTNTASFQAYIKSLSLLENKEFVEKMPDLPEL